MMKSLLVILGCFLYLCRSQHVVADNYVDDIKPYTEKHGHGSSYTYEQILEIQRRDDSSDASENQASDTNTENAYEIFYPKTQLPPKLHYNYSVVKYKGYYGCDDRFIPGHLTIVDNPLKQFSVSEPVHGCNGKTPSKPSETSKHRSTIGKHCKVVANGGFFDTQKFTCLGNVISDKKVVQISYKHNSNFGIREDGSIVVGYIPDHLLNDPPKESGNSGSIPKSNITISDQDKRRKKREASPDPNSTTTTTDKKEEKRIPFVNLITGVIWLVRNGVNYVDKSKAMEDMSIQSTGDSFITAKAARTAVGHDADGRVHVLQYDGKTWARGINLHELADVLVEIGIVNAINLDGGGSTTTVFDDVVTNIPSDIEATFKGPDGEIEKTFERPIMSLLCLHEHEYCDPDPTCSHHGSCVEVYIVAAGNLEFSKKFSVQRPNSIIKNQKRRRDIFNFFLD